MPDKQKRPQSGTPREGFLAPTRVSTDEEDLTKGERRRGGQRVE
jgi:hypothetical protein